VRGRRSASTSSARSRTTHTIAQGTRNELDIVIEVTTALSDAAPPKLTLSEVYRHWRATMRL
jgi:hypothetical protein